MYIAHKSWVPLVGKDVLERAKADKPNSVYLRRKLWRQIEVRAELQLITITLMNVDEEAALGGYLSSGEFCREVKLPWNEIEQRDRLEEIFAHEQACVLKELLRVMEHFRAFSRSAREVIAF